MLNLFGYFACITVDGVQLPEFKTDIDETTRTATCWIPSEAGKKFAVLLQSSRTECDSSANVFIDGSSVRQSVISPAKPGVNHFKNRVIDFVRSQENGVEVQRPFCFSTITSTDDELYLHRHLPQGLGEIVIAITRICVQSMRPATVNDSDPTPISHEILHESFKKVAVHCVSFGDSVPSVPKGRCQIRMYNRTDPKPFARFVFKYRPADVLQADDIMPRPPRLQKRKFSGDNALENGEIRDRVRNLPVKLEGMEVAAQKQIRKGSTPKMEPFGQSGSKDDAIDLTRDATPIAKTKKSRRSSFDPGEVIDLT